MIRISRQFTYLFIVSLLSACTANPLLKEWPENIPSVKYFTDYYQKDLAHQQVLSQEDYIVWVHRFYFGWEIYPFGWLNATDKLIQSLPLPERDQAQSMMQEIGRLVSPEWAKNKKFRVINTRHLNIWGNALNHSITEKKQIELLKKILQDVNFLLDEKITPKEIVYQRYSKPIPFDPFL